MEIAKNVPLEDHHTFGLKATASHFIEIFQEEELSNLIPVSHQPVLIIGGGSNVLFVSDFQGLIIKNRIQGIQVIFEDQGKVTVEVRGGVNWHKLVLWAVNNNYGGLENLSLIPGTVGAAPIQNIGAYGVEFESVFESLEAIELSTGKKELFNKEDCCFGYRTSIFKRDMANQFFICCIRISLTKKNHQINTEYGEIEKALIADGVVNPSIKDVSDAVIKIRSAKLPDPGILGNAGSFFKNPVITAEKYAALSADYPDIPGYSLAKDRVKVPAAWLIEKVGWKGYRSGDAGVYNRHALVLVNYGNASGSEIRKLAAAISQSVKTIFDIEIEREVTMIGA